MSRHEMRVQGRISLNHHTGRSRSEARREAEEMAGQLGIQADKAIEDALDLFYGRSRQD
jgi:hypothetical protein